MPNQRRRAPWVGWRRSVVCIAFFSLAAAACGETDPTGIDGGGDPGDELICDLDRELLVSDLPPGAIPALTEPATVTAAEPGALYLEDSDRVVGVVIDGTARAYPHAILDHHEVVNDRVGDRWFTVTFCPLTGSALGLDPHIGEDRLDLGVSGLLFANNLVLYDRDSGEVYGPQLSVEGRCSGFRGETMDLLPVMETSWSRWKELHPTTTVVSSATGFNRNYRESPYERYRENDDLLYDMPLDETRPLKERVLAIRMGETGGKGYPFGGLDARLGTQGVINDEVGGEPTVIFYEGSGGQTAIAFRATVEGQALTFEVQEDGTWTDQQTGTTWRLDGVATDGPLAGERLQVREDAFVVYWFAWRFFQPDAEVWQG